MPPHPPPSPPPAKPVLSLSVENSANRYTGDHHKESGNYLDISAVFTLLDLLQFLDRPDLQSMMLEILIF